jgi:L-iditol 2-dehydrogenase
MKALRLYGPGDLRLVDEAPPVPGPNEELVRVTAVGVCGSDLHWYAESGIGDVSISRPIVLGHEAAGVIESGPRRGLRVAIDPAIPCEKCEQCRAGHSHFCLALRFAGDGATDGLLRELVAWPTASLIPVPDSLSNADVAMLEPLGVALHAIRLGAIRPGERVGVFGCGPIGLLIIQLARASGATTIVATDVLPHRLAAAREAGATSTALVAGGSERAELRAATGGHGVDIAFEAAGVDDSVETSVSLAAPGGTVVIVGIPSEDHTTFTASTGRRKGLTIKFSRRMNRVYPETIRLVEAGLADVRSIVTASYPLSEHKAAFATAAAREGLKIVISPSGSPSE